MCQFGNTFPGLVVNLIFCSLLQLQPATASPRTFTASPRYTQVECRALIFRQSYEHHHRQSVATDFPDHNVYRSLIYKVMAHCSDGLIPKYPWSEELFYFQGAWSGNFSLSPFPLPYWQEKNFFAQKFFNFF